MKCWCPTEGLLTAGPAGTAYYRGPTSVHVRHTTTNTSTATFRPFYLSIYKQASGRLDYGACDVLYVYLVMAGCANFFAILIEY